MKGRIRITLDGQPVAVDEGATLLEAARGAGVYVPSLCHHPDLPPAREVEPSETIHRGDQVLHHEPEGDKGHVLGCRLCLVSVAREEEPVRACETEATEGLEVTTSGPALTKARRKSLLPILAHHPHACLTCAQSMGCSREPCSANVEAPERCCPEFHRCELQRVVEHVGVPAETPRYVPRDLPVLRDDPLVATDFNLCIGCLRCVRACRDLRGVDALGYVVRGDEIAVGTREPGLRPSGCRFCTACVEVCPTGALTDRAGAVRDREAELVPCRHACPAGTDVPRYVRLVGEGRFAEAHAVVRRRAPFPGVLGHVCFHPCEDACRRGELDEPVSICAIKRRAYDSGAASRLWTSRLPRPEPSGKSVAVVGSGPAGLTAAYYLARKGHGVTIFESRPRPGGMMRYGIPSHRLPPEVLEEEIADVVAQGVEIRTSTEVGKDVTLDGLLADGFEAAFLAVGATRIKRIPLEGAELAGVHHAIDLLARAAQGEAPAMSGAAVVIGGGGVAMDAAMIARRLGADPVTILCLESEEEMPAHSWEVAHAREEAITIENRWGPARLLGNGRVTGVELKRCLSVFDDTGRFRPRYDEDARRSLDAETVILAVGQEPDLDLLTKDGGLEASSTGTLRVNQEDLATPVTGLFAGGDVTRGPSSVIEAIADGRRAAAAIDRSLGGDGDLEERLVDLPRPSPRIGRVEGFADLARAPMPCAGAESRIADGDLVELGLAEDEAGAEGRRCLQCDLRLSITPVSLPPERWRPLTPEELEHVPHTEGAYQLVGEDGKVLAIAGTPDLQQALEEKLASGTRATHFCCEEDPMYTRRESELIQQHLQAFGEMPGAGGGEDDLDDLF